MMKTMFPFMITQFLESGLFDDIVESEIKKKKVQKPIYHTFDFAGRDITLCIKVKDNTKHEIVIGYSVKVKEDTFNQELAERISFGRAESDKARLFRGVMEDTLHSTRLFKSIGEVWERKIKNNPFTYIKGIQKEDVRITIYNEKNINKTKSE